MLAVAWVVLAACAAFGSPWTGDARHVDAVILDNTQHVRVDGGNIVINPFRRLIVVDGDRVSSRRLITPPLLLTCDGYTIVIFEYWGDAEAVRTRHYHEIQTSDQAWLQGWRWQEATESIAASPLRQAPMR